MARAVEIVTTDAYQRIVCPGTVRVTLQVSDAAVYIGFGRGQVLAQYDSDETYLPVSGALERLCDEIRIKSRTPGVPAVVFLTALTERDG